MVDEALKILSNPKRDIIEFGNLMHEAWCIKKSISNNITTDLVDSMYEKARANGAVGGKLMGAGGGGFMVLFVAPEKQNKVRQALNGFVHVPFQFDKLDRQFVYMNLEPLKLRRDREMLWKTVWRKGSSGFGWRHSKSIVKRLKLVSLPASHQ